ncbi:hypothetical protein NMY22_g17502 [Coprinellus aureogranulatus]|nr:hypothetical protein NMY22_g17502 [Coprinellus aureogranulatus]
MSDSESAASSSRSPSPALKKSKSKTKSKDANGKNEGTDPAWEFQPPPGRFLLEDSFDVGEFDWENVKNNEDLELVAIRVPKGFKPKHLDGLTIASTSSSQSTKVGSIKRKHATFDVWSVGAETPDDCPVTGEEIRHLSCLLPRKKKGKLFPAPRGIARHLVLAAQPVEPSAPASESIPPKDAKSGKYQNPPRQCYPDDRLTHTFAPYGSHTTIAASEEEEKEGEMDVDEEPAPTKQKEEEGPSKKSKSKKRKGAAAEAAEDAPVPKKKKSKVSA